MELPSHGLSAHSWAFEVREKEKEEAQWRPQIPQCDTVLVPRQVYVCILNTYINRIEMIYGKALSQMTIFSKLCIYLYTLIQLERVM